MLRYLQTPGLLTTTTPLLVMLVLVAFQPATTQHSSGNVIPAMSSSPTPCSLAWDVVPSPSSRDARGSQLNAIAASSSEDVWAVGKQQINGSTNLLTEHWNG